MGATEAAARDKVVQAVIALGSGFKGLQAGHLKRSSSATPKERLEAVRGLGEDVAAAVDEALAQWPVATVVGWWCSVLQQMRQMLQAGSQPRRSKRSKGV
jgi:hypothetical protein